LKEIMFFISSISRWWLPAIGIGSSLIIGIIPVAYQNTIQEWVHLMDN
jgi:hypothetical protein